MHAGLAWGAGRLALGGAPVAMTEGVWRPAAGAVPTPVDSETLSTVLFTLAEHTTANGRTGEGIIDRVMWTLGKVRASKQRRCTNARVSHEHERLHRAGRTDGRRQPADLLSVSGLWRWAYRWALAAGRRNGKQQKIRVTYV